MTSRLTPERIRELLSGLEGLRVLAPEERVQCVEVPLEYNGIPVFAYFFPGRFSEGFFARIVSTPMGCMEALASPAGLYTFYLGDDELFRKSFQAKVDAVTRLSVSRRE